MTMVSFLNISGLLVGFVAAVLMYYFPPRITVYTEEGAPHVFWIGEATEEGRRKGKHQRGLSKAAPLLLATAFLLQLMAAFLSASNHQ